MHTVVLVQAAATGNDLNTLVNNVVSVLATPALGLLTLAFLIAGISYSLSPLRLLTSPQRRFPQRSMQLYINWISLCETSGPTPHTPPNLDSSCKVRSP